MVTIADVQQQTNTVVSATDKELVELQKQDHAEIRDVDIRENNKKKLRFRKMPWHELIGVTIFTVLCLACVYKRETHMFRDNDYSDSEMDNADDDESNHKLK